MPANQMRKLSRTQLNCAQSISRKAASTVPASVINVDRTHVCRSLISVKDAIPASTVIAKTGAPFSDFFFGISQQTVYAGDVRSDDVHPPDPRTLKLGKSEISLLCQSLSFLKWGNDGFNSYVET